MNVILMRRDELDDHGVVTLNDARAVHLVRILGVVPGRVVRVGMLDGPLGTGTVTSTREEGVTLHCTFEVDTPPRPPIDLLLALPRPKVMKRLWAQLAALGVGRIILTNAGRVERQYFDTHVLAPATYEPLLIEGLQQARDTRVPLVSIHRQFKVLIEHELDTLVDGVTRLAADPGAEMPIGLAAGDGRGDRILLAVGPERGWNDFERRLLVAHGFQAVSMGERTLRVDTACIALLGIASWCHASPDKR